MSDLILKTLETRELKLNTMQLRGFYGKKMRRGSGGGSSGDGFPVLPGDVTRWHFGGLTNEMMAAMDDPRLEDADGKGRFLSFKNFLWAGMSGCDGYTESFSKIVVNYQSEINSNTKITITGGRTTAVNIRYNRNTFNSYIKVTGLNTISNETNGLLIYNSLSSSEKGFKCNTDGIYKVEVEDIPNSQIYIWLQSKTAQITYSNPITVEILPLYPGALVFDGVDDYGICENFPILTKEKGYTVVALRQWMETTNKVSGVVSNALTWFTDGAFVLEYRNINSGYENTPVSFGRINPNAPLTKSAFTYQTSLEYNGVKINTGTYKGVSQLTVGSVIKNNYLFKGAIWEIVILDHDATEEELQKIQDYYKQEYPWLFPDQAWAVTGKTNEDEDRATIANITGNGNNLVLSNLGFIEGSGYNEEGEYAGYLVTDGVDDKIQSSNFPMGKDFTIVGEWRLISVSSYNYAGIIKSNNLYVYNNASTGLNIYVCSSTTSNYIHGVKSLKAIRSDGRVYDENWTEYKLKNVGDNIGANSTLDIGTNKNNFTKIAFKNLEIYNNKILSKEDCIKAYNYLQTLKAK